MKDLPEFYVFGSASSKDWDVLFIVDKLEETIQLNHHKIDQLCETVKHLSNGIEVNGNLAVIDNGILVKVFKGTSDEVNNSVMKTYGNHKQYFPLRIERLIKRDELLKASRFGRFLLSFYSRTPQRATIKLALRGNLKERLLCLKELDLSTPIENKKESLIDIHKVIAFQIAQTWCLIDGIEVYSKESALAYFPLLEPYLLRVPDTDIYHLNSYKNVLVDKLLNKFSDNLDYMEVKSEFLV